MKFWLYFKKYNYLILKLSLSLSPPSLSLVRPRNTLSRLLRLNFQSNLLFQVTSFQHYFVSIWYEEVGIYCFQICCFRRPHPHVGFLYRFWIWIWPIWWLEPNVKKVNWSKTPWLVVIVHAPWSDWYEGIDGGITKADITEEKQNKCKSQWSISPNWHCRI